MLVFFQHETYHLGAWAFLFLVLAKELEIERLDLL